MKKMFSLGQAVKDIRRQNFSNSYFLYGNDIFMQDFFIKELKKIKKQSKTYLYYLGYDNQENIFCDFTFEDIPSYLSDSLRISLYRITQEGLTNTLKYSKASKVNVKITTIYHHHYQYSHHVKMVNLI